METKILGPGYEAMGVLEEGEELSVYVARRPGTEELLLVNRVSLRPEVRPFFRDLYGSFSRRGERSEFLELFSAGRDICAVFRYHQGPSLAQVFRDCRGSAAGRLDVLEAALLRVHSAAGALPAPVICGLLRPENLLLDGEGNIRLLYRFQSGLLEEGKADIRARAAELLEFMLARELKSPYFKEIRTVHKKCASGLSASLPALVCDIKRAGGALEERDAANTVRSFVRRKKERIAQISWLGMVTLFAILVVYLITELPARDTAAAEPITAIGTVTYAAARDGEDEEMELDDPAEPEEPAGPVFTGSPTEDDGLLSEDYVMRGGDTLESVCAAYYGSPAYAGPVAAFNGLDAGDGPAAGTVIRLPLRDQLARYIEGQRD